jgi:hypothetical protein
LSIHIQKLAKSCNIETNKDGYVGTPIPSSFSFAHFCGNAGSGIVKVFQRRISSILYTEITTRPDIAHHCSTFADHLLNLPNHMPAADRVLEYLSTTTSHAIHYEPGKMNPINAFTDALYGDNPNRTSSQGHLFKFNRGLVWHATKQRIVTTSTTEGELLSLSAGARELMAFTHFLQQAGYERDDDTDALSISCDNRQTVDAINKDAIKIDCEASSY